MSGLSVEAALLAGVLCAALAALTPRVVAALPESTTAPHPDDPPRPAFGTVAARPGLAPGAALAAAVMGFPLLVRPIRLSLEAIDPGLEEAAKTLGAGRLRILVTIVLPLAFPGILAGIILGFARALGEFGATITFVSNIPGQTQTLSLAIYSLLQSPTGDAAALRLIGFSVFLAVGAILASEWVAARLPSVRKARNG